MDKFVVMCVLSLERDAKRCDEGGNDWSEIGEERRMCWGRRWGKIEWLKEGWLPWALVSGLTFVMAATSLSFPPTQHYTIYAHYHESASTGLTHL